MSDYYSVVNFLFVNELYINNTFYRFSVSEFYLYRTVKICFF